jgi:hypothetical protein
MKLNVKQLSCLAYMFFYSVSGFLRDPLLALLIATLYEVGFVGLMMIYKSLRTDGRQWIYLVCGFVMILISSTWLDTLLKLVGGF